MTPKNLPHDAEPDNTTTVRTSLAPRIQITQEVHEPFQSDLDLKAKGLSAELARRVCLAAGGKLVGKRILVPTTDLCAYLRTRPPSASKVGPRPAKSVPTATMSAEEIALANGLRLVAGERGNR